MGSVFNNTSLLESLLFFVMLNFMLASTSSLTRAVEPNQTETNQATSMFTSAELLQELTRDQVLKMMNQQLAELRQAEKVVLTRLRILKAKQLASSERKRNRYHTSMCVFNVVACYKKKK